jgi:hypothetical protein
MIRSAILEVVDAFKSCGAAEHRLAACSTFAQLEGQGRCALLSKVQAGLILKRKRRVLLASLPQSSISQKGIAGLKS